MSSAQSPASQNKQKAGTKPYKQIDYQQYPNNLLVYVYSSLPQVLKAKGSGCLIGGKYVLTAAHNIQDLKGKINQCEDKKMKVVENNSLVYQGTDEKANCQYEIVDFHLYQNYIKQKKKDYVVLEVNPKNIPKKQNKLFMPIVALSEKTIKTLEQIQLQGFPIVWSKQNAQKKPQNVNNYGISFIMPVQVAQSVAKATKSSILYDNCTQEGFSGGPLIAKYKEQFIIIGIHKGKKSEKLQGDKGENTQYSFAVNAYYMVQQLNQLGYKLEKKPFVYTQKTFQFRTQFQQIPKTQIFALINQDLQPRDMLVFTAFDLTKMTNISLSGNKIGSLGVQYLLRRELPSLTYLFLHQNDIEQLPQQNWTNVKNLQILGLSLNYLRTLPMGLNNLNKIKQLWVSTNVFESIPQAIKTLCSNSTHPTIIYIYGNLINQQAQQQTISQLKKFTNAELIWEMDESDDQ